eukprot:scaffold33844_cov101-Isochrysis_galbana.AAC.1
MADAALSVCGSRTSTSTGAKTLATQPPTHPTHMACKRTEETLGALGLQSARILPARDECGATGKKKRVNP